MTRIQNVQAEEAVLAALLAFPDQIPLVSHKLTPAGFSVPANRKTYKAMLALSAAGRSIDAITLRSEGAEIGNVLDNLHGTSGVILDEYVALLMDAAFRRQVDDHGVNLQQIARTASDQNEILAEMAAFSRGLAQESRDERLIDNGRAIDLHVVTLRERKVRGLGLKYGVPPLDAAIQPVEGGDLVIVAARPSVGKTTLAEAIVDHWATYADKPVLFVSLEMRVAKLMDRGASRWSGVPAAKILRNETTPEEDALVADALERRKVLNIWYVDNPFCTTDTLRAAASKVSLMHGGLTAIVVDYLQILKDKGDPEVTRVTRISGNLKAIAREHDVPLLALSQLNRASEARRDPHPKLFDIRESGAIEQDADVVFGLWRPRGSDVMDIDCLKNRQGPLGERLHVRFEMHTVSVGDEVEWDEVER